jgi:hypothetical protein
MTVIRNGVVIIAAEPPQQCDSCGQRRELRPYGPPGKTMICVPCATATPEMEAACRHRFLALMNGG